MKFLQMWHKTEKTTTFESELFGDYVLLNVSNRIFNCSRKQKEEFDESEYKKNTRTTKESCVVTKKYFDSKVEMYGDDPEWILNISDKECVEEAMHPDYLAAYANGEHENYRYDNGKYKKPCTLTTPLQQILQDGRTELLVIDRSSHDHFFYDLNGKRLFRSFQFDYIQTQISNKRYSLKKVLEYLKTIPQVSEAKIIEVLCYNQDINNEKALEFKYTPKDYEEFVKLTKKSTDIIYQVKELLNLNQFRKEEDD